VRQAIRVARGLLDDIPVEKLPKWYFDNGEVVTLTADASARSARRPDYKLALHTSWNSLLSRAATRQSKRQRSRPSPTR